MKKIKEWKELSDIPIIDKEKEASIRKKLIDSLEEGDYSLGLSTGFQYICDILCEDSIDGFESPVNIIRNYLKELLIGGINIVFLESAMVFPCTGSSILCIDYNSLNSDIPFIITTADMMGLQSETYSLLRSCACSQEAKSCVEAVLDGKIRQGICFLRKSIFSGSQLRHICEQGIYLDFLAVFDALTSRFLLDSNITELPEPDVELLKTYISDKKEFYELCRDLLLQRGKIVKVNGQINTKMYALLDYVQHVQNNLS